MISLGVERGPRKRVGFVGRFARSIRCGIQAFVSSNSQNGYIQAERIYLRSVSFGDYFFGFFTSSAVYRTPLLDLLAE